MKQITVKMDFETYETELGIHYSRGYDKAIMELTKHIYISSLKNKDAIESIRDYLEAEESFELLQKVDRFTGRDREK